MSIEELHTSVDRLIRECQSGNNDIRQLILGALAAISDALAEIEMHQQKCAGLMCYARGAQPRSLLEHRPRVRARTLDGVPEAFIVSSHGEG